MNCASVFRFFSVSILHPFFVLALISQITFFQATRSQAAIKYQAGTYELDPTHSKVGFEIPHLVISTVEGKFNKSQGTITLDEKFEKSKVSAEVEISSIDTGEPKRDDHLKSPDFFEVAKYPKMTFKSASITGTPESFKMTGSLTLKSETKPVVFEGKFLGNVVDAYGNLRAAFNAKAKISRKEFGLTWSKVVEMGPVVGDEVTIDLKIEATKPGTAAKK